MQEDQATELRERLIYAGVQPQAITIWEHDGVYAVSIAVQSGYHGPEEVVIESARIA